MHVIVNGTPQQLSAGLTVADLLVAHDLQPVRVAVEVNAALCPRRSYAETALREGDRVEIVTLVGGG